MTLLFSITLDCLEGLLHLTNEEGRQNQTKMRKRERGRKRERVCERERERERVGL